MAINRTTIDQRCKATPFALISTPDGNIRLWRTKRAGVHGYQVYGFCYSRDHKGGNDTLYLKTRGYGDGKEADALARIFQWLGRKPAGFQVDSQGASDGCHPWHVGGNFYDLRNPGDWVTL